MARSTHRRRNRLPANTNLERLFDRQLVPEKLQRSIISSPDNLSRTDSVPSCFALSCSVCDAHESNGIIGTVEICHLYISPAHNFFGHHGREPDDYPTIEVPAVECVAGQGLRGDRFFDYKKEYKGQITFFSTEVFERLCQALQLRDLSPSLVRRNVITRDVDLNALIGERFEVQGVSFFGTEECRPCYWLDRAIAAGAESYLKGHGGLRARILSDGTLRSMSKVTSLVG